MNPTISSLSHRLSRQQWSALGLSLALGGLLLAGVLSGLRAGAAAAAGPAEPATAYPCSEAGLNSALAAGGSATFTCAVPTTVTVSGRKTVIHNGTLDGGNRLILSGNNLTGVFTVATGVHLSLLNLTLRDAQASTGAGVYNNGTLNVTHVAFISSTAATGAALYNAPGAQANLFDSSVISNVGGSGAVWNGDLNVLTLASLTVANTSFSLNHTSMGNGAAIHNDNGLLTITASSFVANTSDLGGAIYNNSQLWVDGSQFVGNQAGVLAADSLSPLNTQSSGALAPEGIPAGGGAIYMTGEADTIVHSSSFTNNVGVAAGGAIFFDLLPPAKVLNDGHHLSIDGSLFYANCTAGLGGAVAASKAVVVSNSTFENNRADIVSSPCHFGQASAPSGPAVAAPQITNPNGSGGAILSSFSLSVTNSNFLHNAATITTSEGGGAVYNFTNGQLYVSGSLFDGNSSDANGGAILIDGSSLANVVGSDFNNNRATGGSGGAIANLGALTVDFSNFKANSQAQGAHFGGGAIFSLATFTSALAGPNGSAPDRRPTVQAPQGSFPNSLSLNHSTFTANTSDYEGGALDVGQARVSTSSFMNNTAAYGGAIDELQAVTVTASTFYANAAITTTANSAHQGGAIDTNGEQTWIGNSTFYHNRAEGTATGGAINVDFFILGPGVNSPNVSSSTTISYSTFLSNTADANGDGGAINQAFSGLAAANDVLLAHNAGGDCNTNLVFTGENLEFGDNSCGSASRTGDPKALAPANNGGPTLTSALLPGSDAIDHGDNTGCPSTDQRGAHRPFGTHCDIGAYEFGSLVARLWFPIIEK